jgi:hypothetical protein
VTKADKVNWAVITDRNEYEQKVENFICSNEAIKANCNITDKFQKDLRITINECKQVISADSKWRYINLNPCTPVIRGPIKVLMEDTPIRPINFRNAPII